MGVTLHQVDQAERDVGGLWDEVRGLLGGKGANLGEMTRLGSVFPRVDGHDGRMSRVLGQRQHTAGGADSPRVTRFDRFDALDASVLPFGAGDEVPVASDVVGAFLEACGDPALADTLRERVSAELDSGLLRLCGRRRSRGDLS